LATDVYLKRKESSGAKLNANIFSVKGQDSVFSWPGKWWIERIYNTSCSSSCWIGFVFLLDWICLLASFVDFCHFFFLALRLDPQQQIFFHPSSSPSYFLQSWGHAEQWRACLRISTRRFGNPTRTAS